MENKFAGMTVNERLFVSGFMDEFDRAVEARDVDRIRGILSDVELTEESIGPILEQLGL
jgi:hypothetical protein